jgi:hypothetical protein
VKRYLINKNNSYSIDIAELSNVAWENMMCLGEYYIREVDDSPEQMRWIETVVQTVRDLMQRAINGGIKPTDPPQWHAQIMLEQAMTWAEADFCAQEARKELNKTLRYPV